MHDIILTSALLGLPLAVGLAGLRWGTDSRPEFKHIK